MKTLQDECLLAITKNLADQSIGPHIWKLHRSLKTILLEKIIWHDILNESTWKYVVRIEFFENLRKLILPQNKCLTDKFMSTLSASGCKFDSIFLAVPLIPHDERLAPLSGKGISALFAHQNELETLNLVWCINFKADVLTRIQSDFLRKAEIVGDAVCRCFEYNNVLRDKVHLYQRDLSVLAINNPTITKLCLDGIILDLNDCYTLFSALADSLEHLEIKIVRFYAFCQRTHCFYGRDFVLFLELVDRICHRLKYFSCFSLQTDVQNRQVVMKSNSLETLCLEGHVFQLPLILPPNLRKLKFSINGYETEDHFKVLHDQLPRLEKLYLHFDDDFAIVNEQGLVSLFSFLGPKLISLTNINAVNFNRISQLICIFCTNLKELSVVRAPGAGLKLAAVGSGSHLLPLFQDEVRSLKIRHLHLGVENLSQSLLNSIADNCRRLRTLDLAYCRTIDDAVLIRLAENCCSTLKILELSLCSGITDEGISAIAEKCLHLEEIIMFQTKIGNKSVSALANKCSKLRYCGVNNEQINETTMKLLTDNEIRIV